MQWDNIGDKETFWSKS